MLKIHHRRGEHTSARCSPWLQVVHYASSPSPLSSSELTTRFGGVAVLLGGGACGLLRRSCHSSCCSSGLVSLSHNFGRKHSRSGLECDKTPRTHGSASQSRVTEYRHRAESWNIQSPLEIECTRTVKCDSQAKLLRVSSIDKQQDVASYQSVWETTL